jgi:hypothetical protein
MKLLDLINHLATKCGKQNEQPIIDLLSRTDLQNIDVADDVANSINNSLLTVDSAKNNPLLKNHFTALALGSVDAELMNTIQALELGDDFKTEVSGITNTFEKQRKLTDKLKEVTKALREAKKDGDGKDVEKYTKQINDLNAELSRVKESTISKSEYDTLKKNHESQLTDFALTSMISGFNFANANVPKEVNVLTAKTLLENALKGKAVIVRDQEGILKLKQASDQTLDYYDESQKAVNVNDFANKVFADNKLLAVSGTMPNIPPVHGVQTYVIPQPGQMNTAKFDASMQASLGDLK